MGTQSEAGRWRQQELALTAVEHRLQALGEYLAVYRASYASSGEGRHYARVRMLRKDICLLYTSPSPRDATLSRMPSSA